MKFLVKYDRTLSITSLYILIPAFYSNKYIFVIMNFQTIFSILHWYNYNNIIFHKFDLYLSTFIFCYHIFSINNFKTLIFCILSLILFYKKKGYRELILTNSFKFVYIIPHSLFRFLSFWFIMFCYDIDFSVKLSLVYWINIIIFMFIF